MKQKVNEQDLQMDLDQFALFNDCEREESEKRSKKKQDFMKGSHQSLSHHFQRLNQEDIVPSYEKKNPNDRSILAYKQTNEATVMKSIAAKGKRGHSRKQSGTSNNNEFKLFWCEL